MHETGRRGTLLAFKIGEQQYTVAFTQATRFNELMALVEEGGLAFAHHALFHLDGLAVLIGGGTLEQEHERSKGHRERLAEVRESTEHVAEAWRIALTGSTRSSSAPP